MCDVEHMFHQFHVAPRDQDYLRFLWCEGGNLKAPPSVYRMKIHLFGAASSPGCAKEKMDWDEPLPGDLELWWEAWLQDFHNLS